MSPARRRTRPLWIPLVSIIVIAGAVFAAIFAIGWAPKLGLDLAGGAYVVYTPHGKTTTSNLNEAKTIIENRIAGNGIASAQVQVQGQDIVVQMAGIKNPQKLLQLIGQTGQVEFRPVACAQGNNGVPLPPYTAKTKSATSSITPQLLNTICQKNATSSNSESNQLSAIAAQVPSTEPSVGGSPPQYVLYPAPELTQNKRPYYRYLLGPLAATGTIIKTASAGVVSGTPGYVVDFTMTSSGSKTWDNIAQANFHKQVAIAVGGQIVSAPAIQPSQSSFTSFNGQGQISGGQGAPISADQANQVAVVMRYGALPVQLHQQTVQTVSPSLGKSSLRAGLFAGLIGLALVMVYMILYYRALGFVVVSGLGLTGVMLWTVTSILGHTSGETLDLAGVTGVIVSIGITADSYVIYFERLKDQVRAGRSVRTSVDKTFRGAFRTVLIADLVSMIGALVLYVLAVGLVKGFAFFLGLSTLMNVVVTYYFTRPLVFILARNERIAGARIFGITRGLAAGEAV